MRKFMARQLNRSSAVLKLFSKTKVCTSFQVAGFALPWLQSDAGLLPGCGEFFAHRAKNGYLSCAFFNRPIDQGIASLCIAMKFATPCIEINLMSRVQRCMES